MFLKIKQIDTLIKDRIIHIFLIMWDEHEQNLVKYCRICRLHIKIVSHRQIWTDFHILFWKKYNGGTLNTMLCDKLHTSWMTGMFKQTLHSLFICEPRFYLQSPWLYLTKVLLKCGVILKSCSQAHVTCHDMLFIEMYYIQLVWWPDRWHDTLHRVHTVHAAWCQTNSWLCPGRVSYYFIIVTIYY